MTKKKSDNRQAKEIWRRFRKNKSAMAGLIIFALIVLIAVFASMIVPYENAVKPNRDARLVAPCAEFIFGTDQMGRDMFARIVHGAKYSLSIGVVISALTLLIGGAVGSIVAYYGGTIDNIVMRIMDIFMCIPFMLLAMALVAALGAGLQNLMIALVISEIPGTIRLVRSCVINVADEDYIEAAKSYGTKSPRLIAKHIFPNAMGPIIVNTTMNMASMILAAAGLSFMGLGIQPPTPEWGSMLSNARDYMLTSPHILYIPGIAILISVLSINLIGDGLRDALDPKLKD